MKFAWPLKSPKAQRHKGTKHDWLSHNSSWESTFHKIRSTFYKIWSTFHKIRSTFYKIWSTFHKIRSTFHKIWSTFHKIRSTFHKIWSTFYKIRSTFHKIWSTFHKIRSTFHKIRSTLILFYPIDFISLPHTSLRKESIEIKIGLSRSYIINEEVFVHCFDAEALVSYPNHLSSSLQAIPFSWQ